MSDQELLSGLSKLYDEHGEQVYQSFLTLTIIKGWDNITAYYHIYNMLEK